MVNGILGGALNLDLSWSGRTVNLALSNRGSGVAYPTAAVVQGLQVLSLWLGSNLTNTTNIGQATDAPSVGTTDSTGITFPASDSFCAQMRGVIEQLLTWDPALRLFWVTPYQSCRWNANSYAAGHTPDAGSLHILLATTNAIKAVGLLYGSPFLICTPTAASVPSTSMPSPWTACIPPQIPSRHGTHPPSPTR